MVGLRWLTKKNQIMEKIRFDGGIDSSQSKQGYAVVLIFLSFSIAKLLLWSIIGVSLNNCPSRLLLIPRFTFTFTLSTPWLVHRFIYCHPTTRIEMPLFHSPIVISGQKAEEEEEEKDTDWNVLWQQWISNKSPKSSANAIDGWWPILSTSDDVRSVVKHVQAIVLWLGGNSLQPVIVDQWLDRLYWTSRGIHLGTCFHRLSFSAGWTGLKCSCATCPGSECPPMICSAGVVWQIEIQ